MSVFHYYLVEFFVVVVCVQMSSTKPTNNIPARRMKNGQPDIIFPDLLEQMQEPNFVPQISTNKCKNGKTFCEPDVYPYHLVERNLKNEEQYKYLFGVDESDLVSDRLDEDEFVCASKSRMIFPKAGMNSKNEWKFIVNQNDGKKQGIRVEECQREGSACKLLSGFVYKTSCKQKYAYRRLLSISYNGTLEPDSFLLPVACCCSFKPKINWNPSG